MRTKNAIRNAFVTYLVKRKKRYVKRTKPFRYRKKKYFLSRFLFYH